MRKSEIIFLWIVLFFALLLGGISFNKAGEIFEEKATLTQRALGTAGKARDIDPDRIRKMIEQGYLSEKEAMYYKEANK